MTTLCIIFAIIAAVAVGLVAAALRMSGKIFSHEIDEGALEGDLTVYVRKLNEGPK